MPLHLAVNLPAAAKLLADVLLSLHVAAKLLADVQIRAVLLSPLAVAKLPHVDALLSPHVAVKLLAAVQTRAANLLVAAKLLAVVPTLAAKLSLHAVVSPLADATADAARKADFFRTCSARKALAVSPLAAAKLHRLVAAKLLAAKPLRLVAAKLQLLADATAVATPVAVARRSAADC